MYNLLRKGHNQLKLWYRYWYFYELKACTKDKALVYDIVISYLNLGLKCT